MNPLAVFVLAFFLWLSKGLYLRPLVERLSRVTNELVAYWSVVSGVDVLLAVLVTLLCPNVYFVRWNFPVKVFLVLFAFSVLSFLPAVGELKRFLNPKTKEDIEAVKLLKTATFAQLAFIQVISAALPEELVFRYVFLGLLSLWNPFAGLVAISGFFGISHRFSHPNRKWNVLLSNTLAGLVFGLGYLYTKSLIVVMAVHWLGNLIPELYVKYERARKAIVVAVALSLLSPVAFWDQTARLIAYLRDIFSLSGLLWGIAIGVAMLAIVHAGRRVVRRNRPKAPGSKTK